MWTDSTVKSLEPRNKRYRRSENAGRRGVGRLVIEVRPDGEKTFFFQYFRNHAGKSERVLVRIGRYKESARKAGFTLAEARDRALELSNLVKRGEDPKVVQEEQRRQTEEQRRRLEAEKRQGSFEQLLDSYLANMEANGKRTHKSVASSLKGYVRQPFPKLMKRKASNVEADDIRTILGRMLDKGVTTHTNRIRSYLHAAFQHGLEQDNNPRSYTPEAFQFNLKYNPVAFVPKQADFERVGEHVISEDEIRLIWDELTKFAPLAAAAVQLAFATGGQRLGELLKVPKSDVNRDGKLLTINGGISKNGRDHVVPLNAIALEVLEELDEHNKNCEYLFPGKRGKALVEDMHTSSNTVDRLVREFCEARAEKEDLQKFTPRDIRRTVKTEMGRAGIDKALRDRIQNHTLQDVSAKHYDRYDYLLEKRKALKTWNNHLDLIIRPRGNVTRLKRKNALS